MISKNMWDGIQSACDKIEKKRFYPGTVYARNDIAYKDDGNHYHTLDVYYPVRRKPYNPVIVQIHGGGWMSGDNRFGKRFAYSLAEKGFVVVNINYRLIPDTGIAGQLEDCLDALKWVWNNIHYYSGNRNKITLVGESAGGFLAAYTALLTSSEKLSEKFNLPYLPVKISALGLICPVCYMNQGKKSKIYYDELVREFVESGGDRSLLDIDTAMTIGKMPPTFIVTSTGDFLAKKYCEMLRTSLYGRKITYQYACWKGYNGKPLTHAFPFIYPTIPPTLQTIDMMTKFFKKHCNE
jgi:acetyl esterase/lipase